MTFNTLISASDSKFAVRAYANHLDAIKQNYQKVTALLSTAAVTDPDDIRPLTPYNYFSGKIEEEGFYPGAYIIIGDQEFTLVDAMVDIYNGSEQYANGLDDTEMDFAINDAHGSILGYRAFVDGLVANLHAITAAWAASAAALEDSISARISLFRDKIQTLFADAYDDLSSSVEYWTTALSENYTPSQWVPTAMSIMQVQEAADQDITISESDLYQYTGASPLGPLAFNFSYNAAAMVGYVALQAYIGVCKGIIALGERIFNWGKQKLIEVVSDPDDLYIVNENAPSPSVNNCYQVNTQCIEDRNLTGPHWDLTEIFGTVETLNRFLLDHFMPRYEGKWLHFKLLCGELFVHVLGVGQYSDRIAFQFDYKWRPYVLDSSKMEQFAIASDAPGMISTYFNLAAGSTWSQVSERLLMLQAADIYADSDSAEVDKANGMLVATETLGNIVAMALREACGMEPAYGWYTKPVDHAAYSSVTNKDFVRLAMGYKYENGSWSYNPFVDVNYIVADFIMLFVIHSYDRYINPLSYSFLPYTNDSENFEPGQWGIKTDNQNYEAFNSFGTKAILAIAIIVATIYIGLKIRKWKRNKYLERASFIGRIDNKMWNGETITSAEWDRYIKYSRKLSVSTLMDSKMTRVKDSIDSIKDKISSTNANSADASSSSLEVIKLIRG